jgi:large-conductance mechanosensitive channel
MKKISNYLDNTNDVINEYGNKVFTSISNETIRIVKFILIDNKIMTTAIGFIIATQTNAIATLIIENYLSPVLYKVLTYFTKQPIAKLEDYKKTILGIEFKLGKLVISLLRFVLILIMLYYIFQLIDIEKVKAHAAKTLKD